MLQNDEVYLCKSVVLTTGTFLGGIIHIGDEKISAGRMGDKSSEILVFAPAIPDLSFIDSISLNAFKSHCIAFSKSLLFL